MSYRKITSDPYLTARMRFHQSYYRDQVLKVPAGTGPTRNANSVLGNMLRWEDGQRGLNFLTPAIFKHAQDRLNDTGAVEPFRLLCNMLSSQPMCFNLFGPLIDDKELARNIVSVITGDTVDAVSRVAIEYAPEPCAEFLNDRTAFDAFIEYTSQGEHCFVGIETKLTENFSPKVYSAAKPGYARWLDLDKSPFIKKDWPVLTASNCNQLWRDHLLAIAMLNHPASSYIRGTLLVVHHPEDIQCSKTTKNYLGHLDPNNPMLRIMDLGQLFDVIEAAATPVHDQWCKSFRQRYLDLSFSQAVWDLL